MTRLVRKHASLGLGAVRDGETVDLDAQVISLGLATPAFAAAIVTDLEAGALQKVTATANITGWTTSNRVAGASVRIYVDNTTSGSLSLAFSGSWTWIGSVPTTLASGKLGVLDLTFLGTAEADVVAEWGVEV